MSKHVFLEIIRCVIISLRRMVLFVSKFEERVCYGLLCWFRWLIGLVIYLWYCDCGGSVKGGL